ncbi:MAG: adenosylcobinamide-GDP ribazoletransferase [Phycisphaeraceae bacterium]|nr:adenosylcobinamide-GDP ribazoletransferase [Phycisphaeraceae bacterium]
MRRLLAAFRFLTVLPIPGSWGTAETDLAGSVPFFPVVGLALGGIAFALAWGAQQLALPPLLVSAALTVAMLSFSGGLHMDGLSDTADGFLSSRPRERILEIMKDSHVGAMGVIAIVCVLLVKFAAMASLPPTRVAFAAMLMPLAGRCMIVAQMALLPYARPGGLGSVFYQRRHRLAAAWACVVLGAAGMMTLKIPGLATAGVCLLVTLAFSLKCRRKIGGATGDTFGATCELAETAVAVTLACWLVASV